MDIESIIKARNSVIKPTPYKLGENTLYVRRCNTSDRQAFLDALKDESNRTKLWAIAFGLCDDKNVPLFPDPKVAVETLRLLMNADVDTLYELVCIELGFAGSDATKKD